MSRRRLIIEWNDEGTDTDEECCKSFLDHKWSIEDLQEIDLHEKKNPPSTYKLDLKVWVEDAPVCPLCGQPKGQCYLACSETYAKG